MIPGEAQPPNTVERELKRGIAPLILIFPFPSGEGDTGDGATTSKQRGKVNRRISKCYQSCELMCHLELARLLDYNST